MAVTRAGQLTQASRSSRASLNTCEIVGIGVAEGARTGSRIDPLGIRASIKVVGSQKDWKIAGEKEKGAKSPSEINHSNIAPSVQDLGVTIDYGLHTAVTTLSGLRRLSFPTEDGRSDEPRNTAGRVVLAALSLVALTEQDRAGYALRSRCDLVPQGAAAFELVHADGTAETFELDAKGAAELFEQAVRQAEGHGLPWQTEPVRLVPQERLVELVALSRRKALEGEAELAETE